MMTARDFEKVLAQPKRIEWLANPCPPISWRWKRLMPINNRWINPLLVLAMVGASRIYGGSTMTEKSGKAEIVEVRDFSCARLPGVYFKYPVFKGWNIKTILNDQPDSSAIRLDWPDDLQFETPPAIKVLKTTEPFPLARKIPENPQGIPFVSGIKNPAKGQTSCEFYIYSEGFTIRIILNFSGPGFSQDIFWKQVIDTFQYKSTEVSPLNGSAEMNKEIQEAFRHQKEGRVFLAKKDFKQAVHEFRAGLADLAKASRPERTDVIDDTGQKLTLASHKQDKGDFEHAANILNGVLESRLEMAVPVSRQKALEIARVDAEKQHRDWSKYEVSAILERDGWHIAYLSKDSQRGGGGPEYVIDVNTGKIVSKHYAR